MISKYIKSFVHEKIHNKIIFFLIFILKKCQLNIENVEKVEKVGKVILDINIEWIHLHMVKTFLLLIQLHHK